MGVVTKEGEGCLAVLQRDSPQGLLDDIFHDRLVHVLHAWCSHLRASVARALLAAHSLQRLSVLCGNHNSVDFEWLYRSISLLQVLNGHLSLAIRTQPPNLPFLRTSVNTLITSSTIA